MAHTLVRADTSEDALRKFRITVILLPGARVHLSGAQHTSPVRVAGTRKPSGGVGTRRSILARRRHAVVVVHLTVVAAPAVGAQASVREHAIKTRPAVQAWVRRTLI